MTNDERIKIIKLREAGAGYMKIAKELNINLSTVKSFCKRKINVGAVSVESIIAEENDGFHCLNCGKELENRNTPRKRKFCCDECRQKYWNTHRELIKRKNGRTVTCNHCHKDFIVYGTADRKYCSIKCFMDERYRNGKVCNINGGIQRIERQGTDN